MKKIFLHIGLLLVLGVFVNSASMAQKLTVDKATRPTDYHAPKTEALGRAVGDDCNNPYIVNTDVLPVNYEDSPENGTCGHGNTYDGEILAGYDNGEDVVYKIQVAEEAQVFITLDGVQDQYNLYWHSIALYEGCPDVNNPLIFAKTGGSTNPITFNYILDANKEYFVVVDYFGSEGDMCLTSYTINIDISTDIVEFYDLYVAGTQVSEINAGDLSVIPGVTGTITYDADSKTLTLDNATIDTVEVVGILSSVEDLKINLVGENTINTEACFSHDKPAEIHGNGSLMSASLGYVGIYMNKAPLTIKDCSIQVSGSNWGIAGENGQSGEDLVIENATVKATGADFGSIMDIQSLTLNGDCMITAPEGAAFDESLHAVVLNGEVVKEQVVIEPANGIEDVENMLGVSIYPNPAKDFVQINIEDAITNELSLQVYDMLGKLIESQTITEQTTQLNIKNLEKGVYILKIGNSTKRLIKN